MAIIPRTGSRDTASSREQPISVRPELQRKEPVLDGQAIVDDRVINNNLMNKTSFNEDHFMDNRSLIAGYPEGRIILVTYFSQNHPLIDTMAKPADVNMLTYNDVHISWTQIRNFEVRLQSELNYEYSSDSNRSQTESSGIVLPGFVPRIGDCFFYMMRNGKIGLFYISDINRLALGQETYHQINFTMQGWLDAPMRDRFQRQSTSIFYFDKEKFLTGNVAFMTTQGYVEKKELLHIRREIIQNYMDRFYDTEFSSFMRPDDVYDPYVVEYWTRKVNCDTTNDRPIQLFVSMQNYKKTIWSVLTNNPIKTLKNLSHDFTIVTDFHTFWDVNITSLIGHRFLYVGKERGAVKSPTINTDGTPNSINAYPYNLGYYEPWRSMFRKNSDDQFAIDRFWFYRGFLPFRRCAPHQHPIDYPMQVGACDPKKCNTCIIDKDGKHKPLLLFNPPFPILSNEELGKIWLRLHNLTHVKKLTPQQEAEQRGYILWYRTEYPGTLSKMELEAQWREEASLPPDHQLTEGEEKGLQEYIQSYRSKFLPILQDRELEYIWRTKMRIDFDQELTLEQNTAVMLFITHYRERHGFPPEGEDNDSFPVIGSPITSEEVKAAGAVMYNDGPINLEATFQEYMDMLDGKEPQPKPDPIPPDYVPTIFHPKHPHPNQHVHCHSICHEKCQNRPIKDICKDPDSYGDTYVLSKEFYLGSLAMSPFERLLYDCITNKEIRPDLILQAVEGYLEWDDETAFYQHLLSLYLIDKALFWLKYHS